MEIIIHAAVIVFDPIFQEQPHGHRTLFPPGRDVPYRALPPQIADEVNALVQDGLLLFRRHGDGILMRVPVQADLVPGIGYHLHLPRKRFDGVTGDEPGGCDPVPVEQIEQAWAAHLPGKQTAGDIARRVLTAIRPQPAGHGVHVDAIRTQDLLCHRDLLSWANAIRPYSRNAIRLYSPQIAISSTICPGGTW